MRPILPLTHESSIFTFSRKFYPSKVSRYTVPDQIYEIFFAVFSPFSGSPVSLIRGSSRSNGCNDGQNQRWERAPQENELGECLAGSVPRGYCSTAVYLPPVLSLLSPRQLPNWRRKTSCLKWPAFWLVDSNSFLHTGTYPFAFCMPLVSCDLVYTCSTEDNLLVWVCLMGWSLVPCCACTALSSLFLIHVIAAVCI